MAHKRILKKRLNTLVQLTCWTNSQCRVILIIKGKEKETEILVDQTIIHIKLKLSVLQEDLVILILQILSIRVQRCLHFKHKD